MNILITGGTGLVGSALIKQLMLNGNQITVLTRDIDNAKKKFPCTVNLLTTLSQLTNFNDFDAVINLAGEPIFQHYWSSSQKQKLYQSRIEITANLVQLINSSSAAPILISASAMGIYGDQEAQEISEQSPIYPKDSFAAYLCEQWEKTALQAKTRVCLLRTGIILSRYGGALQKMLPLYRLGLGGKLGNGQQYWSWIALEDMVNGIQFLLNSSQCQGVFNFVAPEAIRNKEFNCILSSVLHRLAICHIPRWLLTVFLGERAQILLDSQKGIPQALQENGFKFQYNDLQSYLSQLKY